MVTMIPTLSTGNNHPIKTVVHGTNSLQVIQLSDNSARLKGPRFQLNRFTAVKSQYTHKQTSDVHLDMSGYEQLERL